MILVDRDGGAAAMRDLLRGRHGRCRTGNGRS